jgi:hypothetical protein
MTSLLQPARPEAAFLKMGIYGQPKAGKTFTASSILIGFHKFMKSDKPIAFLDTETGSDYIQHRFKAAGIPLLVAKTRAFKDLLDITDQAENLCFALLVDSITHPWDELMSSYQKQNNLSRITLRHWIPIKAMWREFTTKYVNSKIHFIVCGRAGDIWEETVDENNEKELRRTGTKMRTEKELGYEPSLLVEMEAIQSEVKFGGAIINRAYVKGDRFDVINGQIFDNPTFETFLPHIQLLNLGGEHKAMEVGRTSVGIFDDPNRGEKRIITRDILIEEIEGYIKLLYGGQTEADKTARTKIIMELTGGRPSWTAVTQMRIEELEIARDTVKAKITEREPGQSVQPPPAFAPNTDPAKKKKS